MTSTTSPLAGLASSTGAVFTTTNEAGPNRVLAFPRAADGRLGEAVAYETGGTGSGNGLGSQAALALTEKRQFLLVVNAGSNDLTSFAVDGAKLEMRARVASGGVRPVSVAVRENLVYVLNAGDPGNISAFRLDDAGGLDPIDESTRPLGSTAAGAAQVVISHDSSALVVTERTTHQLDVYTLDEKGRAKGPSVHPAAGRVPFGFEMTRSGHVIVSEAGTQSVSSYHLVRGALTTISPAVPLTQAAPCWLVVSHDDRFAFVANAGSNSIASCTIDASGVVTLLHASAAAVGRPLDLGLDGDGNFLYVIDRNAATIAILGVRGGELEPIATAGALPPTATGVAAY